MDPEIRQTSPTTQKRLPGLSAKTILIPAMVVVLSMHVLIVFNTLRINRAGQRVSQTMEANFNYAQTVNAFGGISDALTDLARSFVSTGNVSYLRAYREMVEQERQRNVDAAPRLEAQSEAGYELLMEAVGAAQERMLLDYHAMHLASEYYCTNIDAWPELTEDELTPWEDLLGSSEKRDFAARLFSDMEYLSLKSEAVEKCGLAIQIAGEETARSIGRQTVTLEGYRTLQWVLTLVIIVLLAMLCILLFVLLLNPLQKGAELVQKGSYVPSDRGLSELRHLAVSYNDLLQHRRMLEDYLRKQSRTDALTGLPNRLAFQDYISRLGWEKSQSSVTIFSLDVNGLKEANDLHGHAFGDELLRSAAACIRAAFGGGSGRECFRFGGDEFAAFWIDVPQEEIATALERFREKQEELKVSVSVGYDRAAKLSETTVEELFERADKSMYEEKAEYHRRKDAEKNAVF